MSKFTILGATGFIGSRLVRDLGARGESCLTPGRDDPALFEQHLGHVIDCIGINDFMERPHAAIEAHAAHLIDILERSRFDSFLYLSSTRVYRHVAGTGEDVLPAVDPAADWELFNLTKLLGEALCLGDPRPDVRVARLSNVYGADQLFEPVFLPTLIREALGEGTVSLTVSLDSAKDYVTVGDVVDLLPQIAVSGRDRLYNVAAGRNVSNREITDILARLTDCRIEVADGSPDAVFPPIRIDRVREEFDFEPAALLDALPLMVEDARARLAAGPSAASA